MKNLLEKIREKIKLRVIVRVLILVLMMSAVLGTVAGVMSYYSAMESLEKSMMTTAEISASLVSNEMNNYLSVISGLASAGDFLGASAEGKKSFLESRKKIYDWMYDYSYFDLNGKDIFSSANAAGTEYFMEAVSGMPNIYDPTRFEDTGKYHIVLSTPVKSDGKVVGVLSVRLKDNILLDIVNSIKVGQTGSTHIVNSKGTIIAHKDASKVGVENASEMAKKDPKFSVLGKINDRMIKGETGFEKYNYNNLKKIQAFAPIPNTNGWSIGVSAIRTEFLTGFRDSIILTLIVVVIFIFVGIWGAVQIGRMVSEPIGLCVNRLLALSKKGDLLTDVPKIKAKDETAVLLNSLEETVDGLKGIIQDISHHLGTIADGNLTETLDKEYNGDFSPISQAIKKINESLNQAMGRINQAAEEVSTGSEQVSSGSQALAQGATEQASSIEEISATISDVSNQVKVNAANAVKANDAAKAAGESVRESNEKMAEMMGAMNEINASSEEIGKIVKTIEDIAFQTNILALNATVEAARAGSAGKGFAVVAEEVRNLAAKSAEAVKNTTELIQNSIQHAKKGSKMADQTAKALEGVIKNTKEVSEIIEEISQASNMQATAIVEITHGIDQITSVIQTNSATAEESAAASEELSGQAQMLKNLVRGFKIKDVKDVSHIPKTSIEEKNKVDSGKHKEDNSKY
ncbi:MAG: methyl-accepting chemotaxis protein [Clostridia bacterium]|nr:methyl-accepting chemotaxis protein [Clostridia bacterium]